MTYLTRQQLHAEVTRSLKQDSLADFRRDLDKALETADRITAPSSTFIGWYWADRAIQPLRELGIHLEIIRVSEIEPRYQITWPG